LLADASVGAFAIIRAAKAIAESFLNKGESMEMHPDGWVLNKLALLSLWRDKSRFQRP
jgi:hypothetical protein